MYLRFDSGGGEHIYFHKIRGGEWTAGVFRGGEWTASFKGGVFRVIQDAQEYHVSFETQSGAPIVSKSFGHHNRLVDVEEPEVDTYLTEVYDLVEQEAEKIKLLLSLSLNR